MAVCARAIRSRQVVEPVLVHQETDPAQLHAVHRDFQRVKCMQGAQHETVAAQRHDQFGVFGEHLAVAIDQPAPCLLGHTGVAGNESKAHGRLGIGNRE